MLSAFLLPKFEKVPDHCDLDIVGKLVNTYWVARNNMEYLDLFVLGLDEALPTLIISCACSSLEIRHIREIG